MPPDRRDCDVRVMAFAAVIRPIRPTPPLIAFAGYGVCVDWYQINPFHRLCAGSSRVRDRRRQPKQIGCFKRMRATIANPESRNAGRAPSTLIAASAPILADALQRILLATAVFFVASLTYVASWNVATAQPPGTRPPFETPIEPNASEPDGSLPVKAFMFLDESGTPVMMPRMSLEKIDRLINKEAGVETQAQSYALDSLEIDAVAEEGRCEMDVVLRMSIDSSNGKWISIPLRMKNFHRIGPADITGLDEHSMTVAPDGSGYVLQTKTTQARNVIVKMRVVARVANAPARSIDFLLPDVPSTLKLVTPQANVSGEVVGRGDEVVQTEPVLGGRTRLTVESGGGAFTLKWGNSNNSSDSAPVVEVDSVVTIVWDSPQDPPMASVQMTIRNLREPLSSFDIRLPVDADLLDTPTVNSPTSIVEFSSPIAEPEGDRIKLFIPEQERQQRIDLSFDLQLSTLETSANDPLKLQVPTVIGALRQRGEVIVRTSNDYRLRWRSRQHVQSVQKPATESLESDRVYAFRYDRSAFTLPLWLSAKTRQLRLTSETQISLLKSLASLEMTIYATGQTSDGRGLQLDLAQWQLRSIVDLGTGKQLDSFAANQYSEIEMTARLSDEPAPIRIRAERQVTNDDGSLGFALPRIVKNDEGLLIQSATLQIRSDGQRSLVIDLDQSTGLDPMADKSDSDLVEPTLSRFNILPPDAAARVVGVFVEQPSRITLAAEAKVELDGTQLTTSVDWTVSSALSLNGSLPIQFTASASSETEPSGSADAAISPTANEANEWTATVNGAPASFVEIRPGAYELKSEKLLEGTMAIRLRHIQTIKRDDNSRRQLVTLPRPAIPDVSIVGAIKILLRGDVEADLISGNSEGSTESQISTDEVQTLELESLPREPLRLRLRPRVIAGRQRGLSIQRAILRTAVGRNTRYEQLIATVHGDDALGIELPIDASDVPHKAIVDGESVTCDADKQVLRIPLAGPGPTHEVNLEIWFNEVTPSSITTITPMMRLPSAIDRLYWQVVAPSDSHVVWAAPTAGRAMSWEFDRWRLYRRTALTDSKLNTWASGIEDPKTPNESRFLQVGTEANNRYLYVGSDVKSFEVVLVSRGLMWLVTGTLVLVFATLLLYVPSFRSPMTAIVVAIALTGLLVIAPDAAVLVGQLGMISSILVIVMFAIRALISPRPNVRVLKPKSKASARREPSTRTFVKPTEMQVERQPSELSETQAMPPQTEAIP